MDAGQIDIRCYDKPYYLATDEAGHKAYKLLLLGMEKANAVAVAKLTYREREHLAIIRPYDGGAFAPDLALG